MNSKSRYYVVVGRPLCGNSIPRMLYRGIERNRFPEIDGSNSQMVNEYINRITENESQAGVGWLSNKELAIETANALSLYNSSGEKFEVLSVEYGAEHEHADDILGYDITMNTMDSFICQFIFSDYWYSYEGRKDKLGALRNEMIGTMNTYGLIGRPLEALRMYDAVRANKEVALRGWDVAKMRIVSVGLVAA